MAGAKSFADKHTDIGPTSSGTTSLTATPAPTTTRTPSSVPTVSPTRAPTIAPSITTAPSVTAVPSPTTRPTITGAPITEQFRTSATAGSVQPGKTATITAQVTSRDATNVLVDVEIYNSAGAKVHQQYFSNQQFSAQQTRQYSLQWAVPVGTAPGIYTIRMGIFSNSWSPLYHWNNTAGTIQVETVTTPTSTPTRAPSPTATRTPTPVQKSTVAVYAKGFPANNTYPTMQVYINNTLVKTFTNVQDKLTTPLTFEFSRKIVSSDVIKVAFTNDYYTSRTNDRNLLIDKIQIDTKIYQTEASTVYGTGVATSAGCKSGYLKQQQLNCNGYFQYNLQ